MQKYRYYLRTKTGSSKYQYTIIIIIALLLGVSGLFHGHLL